MSGRALAAPVLAALALASCGGDQDEPTRAVTGACGVDAGSVVTGPFCLARAVDDLGEQAG